MKCKNVQKLLPDYLTGRLEESDLEKFQKHLGTCPECQAEVNSMKTIWTDLGSIQEEQPAPELKLRFNSMVEAYKQGLKQAKPFPDFGTMFRQWLEKYRFQQSGFQFAFSSGVLVVGILLGYIFSGGFGDGQEISRLRAEVNQMRQTVALTKLDQDSPGDRLQGVLISAEIAEENPDMGLALLNTLNNDPSVNIRLAAVQALYLCRNEKKIRDGLINSLKEQKSPLVQIALIDLIAGIKEEKALNSLKELVKQNHLNPQVRERAEFNIHQIM